MNPENEQLKQGDDTVELLRQWVITTAKGRIKALIVRGLLWIFSGAIATVTGLKLLAIILHLNKEQAALKHPPAIDLATLITPFVAYLAFGLISGYFIGWLRRKYLSEKYPIHYLKQLKDCHYTANRKPERWEITYTLQNIDRKHRIPFIELGAAYHQEGVELDICSASNIGQAQDIRKMINKCEYRYRYQFIPELEPHSIKEFQVVITPKNLAPTAEAPTFISQGIVPGRECVVVVRAKFDKHAFPAYAQVRKVWWPHGMGENASGEVDLSARPETVNAQNGVAEVTFTKEEVASFHGERFGIVWKWHEDDRPSTPPLAPANPYQPAPPSASPVSRRPNRARQTP